MKMRILLFMLLMPMFTQAQDEVGTDVIKWIANRKLNWNDFKGSVPAITSEAALSQCGFGYETNKVNRYEELIVTVSPIFYRQRSWAHPRKRSIRLLQHEQRHFDLCEVSARKLRKRLAKQSWTGADKHKVSDIYQGFSDELKQVQAKYDDETIHGLNTDKQHEWNEKIGKELDELSEFASK